MLCDVHSGIGGGGEEEIITEFNVSIDVIGNCCPGIWPWLLLLFKSGWKFTDRSTDFT